MSADNTPHTHAKGKKSEAGGLTWYPCFSPLCSAWSDDGGASWTFEDKPKRLAAAKKPKAIPFAETEARHPIVVAILKMQTALADLDAHDRRIAVALLHGLES